MKSPITSVVIPAYNAEKTIAETVNSVLVQTFNDFELIIINDGSTDQTLEILQQFSDSRIQIYSFKNAGPQKSRNRGLKKAKGTFISFIDADDLWTSNKLELQIKALQDSPDASVVYSWCDAIDKDSHFLRRGGHFTHRGNVFKDLILINFAENGSNFLAYAEAVRAVEGFDEDILAGQDRDMLLSLADRYEFEVVPKVQVLYRKSTVQRSWSSNIQRRKLGVEKVIYKHTQNRPELLAYRHEGLSNAYKNMIVECLNNHPNRGKGIFAINLLWETFLHDPGFLKKKAFWKALNRIAVTILFSHQARASIMSRFPKIFSVESISVHRKHEISTN